jgi:hypothetical protein
MQKRGVDFRRTRTMGAAAGKSGDLDGLDHRNRKIFSGIFFQKHLCESAVFVTENRRTDMRISQESQYMTFLIREAPLRRMEK